MQKFFRFAPAGPICNFSRLSGAAHEGHVVYREDVWEIKYLLRAIGILNNSSQVTPQHLWGTAVNALRSKICSISKESLAYIWLLGLNSHKFACTVKCQRPPDWRKQHVFWSALACYCMRASGNLSSAEARLVAQSYWTAQLSLWCWESNLPLLCNVLCTPDVFELAVLDRQVSRIMQAKSVTTMRPEITWSVDTSSCAVMRNDRRCKDGDRVNYFLSLTKCFMLFLVNLLHNPSWTAKQDCGFKVLYSGHKLLHQGWYMLHIRWWGMWAGRVTGATLHEIHFSLNEKTTNSQNVKSSQLHNSCFLRHRFVLR